MTMLTFTVGIRAIYLNAPYAYKDLIIRVLIQFCEVGIFAVYADNGT
jgi:hypothetical protein